MTRTVSDYHVVVFCLLLAIGSWVAFQRNPVAFLEPTMFTEDGVWLAKSLREGVWRTFQDARTDYFVVGNLLILHLAWGLSSLFGSGFDDTPRSIAVLSYVFYGLVAALPFVALRAYLPVTARLLICVSVALVPVGAPSSSAEIWGRASNVGFAFAYLTILAILWRDVFVRDHKIDWRSYAVDVLILLCCATNPIAILLTGLYLALRLLKPSFRRLQQDGFLAVGLVMIAVPVLFGVLATQRPAEEAATAVTFGGFLVSGIARPLLYPFTFGFYRFLNDTSGIIGSLLLFSYLGAGLVFARDRVAFGYLLGGMLAVAWAIALQRTLLPSQMNFYAGTYPDRYFYAQNVLVMVAFVWASVAISERISRKWIGLVPPALLVSALMLSPSNIFLPVQVACPATGTDFRQQLANATPIEGNPELMVVAICPPDWTMVVPEAVRPLP